MSRIPSASQTVGPFFNFALTTNPSLGILARAGIPGERIRLEFRVTDGDGAPAQGDCMLELWQADSAGRYAQALADFSGFGRGETDQNGRCTFETVKPGRVAGPDGGVQAPHINVIVFARGLLIQLHTRVYFADEPANVEDPILALVPEGRRTTLLAQPVEGEPGAWHFNIRLQGSGETVFFEM
jgi:protocatechuate 3,4-dioxygenase alpha subunit